MLHFTPSSNELEKNKEVISGLEDMANDAVERFLLEAETAWQPSDFLPDMSDPDAFKTIKELQQRASGLPPEIITSLVGNLITEEALPSIFLTTLPNPFPKPHSCLHLHPVSG